jgi:hypothetical protein
MGPNVDPLRARGRELEASERSVAPARASLALNLTTRGLALKLPRAVQDTRQNAATLRVPCGEVELLLKVQRMQSRPDQEQWRAVRDALVRPGGHNEEPAAQPGGPEQDALRPPRLEPYTRAVARTAGWSETAPLQ